MFSGKRANFLKGALAGRAVGSWARQTPGDRHWGAEGPSLLSVHPRTGCGSQPDTPHRPREQVPPRGLGTLRLCPRVVGGALASGPAGVYPASWCPGGAPQPKVDGDGGVPAPTPQEGKHTSLCGPGDPRRVHSCRWPSLPRFPSSPRGGASGITPKQTCPVALRSHRLGTEVPPPRVTRPLRLLKFSN